MKLKKIILSLSLLASVTVYAGQSDSFIKLYNTKYGIDKIPFAKVTTLINANFDVSAYRQIRAQVFFNTLQQPEYVLVYLFSKKYHRVAIVRVNVDRDYKAVSVIKDYRLTKHDHEMQPGISARQAQCPDPSVEFIAFAPNDIDVEQADTIQVAEAAEAHHLKTVRLLKDDATRDNYLNYMKCPKLKGNFYDGDADPYEITTVDGTISHEDISTELKDQFQYKVTNIWLACEAFNAPMLPAMLDTAQSQKYAAGINDLAVGPSDDAATCAMKKALDHLPMTSSFQVCYKEYDTEEDQWGFEGKGSDFFTT